MGKWLLIAEKPSLMRKIKSAYEKHEDDIPYDIMFMALSGHVCGYAQVKDYTDYGWDAKWQELELPMIPTVWKINVIPRMQETYKKIKDAINTYKIDGIIVATDADREGNLIYYLLEQKMGLQNMKALRFWCDNETELGLYRGLQKLEDVHTTPQHKNMTYASYLRSQFDWLVGMNGTVAATVHTGALSKIGRVKSVVIKMVYDNSVAIENYVQKIVYGVKSDFSEGFSASLSLVQNNKMEVAKFETEEQAKEIIASLSDVATITKVTKANKKVKAPQFFKLSDLLAEANKVFGYSVDAVQETVQTLYETYEVCSYPRCDCRYISSEAAGDFPMLFKAIRALPGLAPFVDSITTADENRVLSDKSYVNDAEVQKNSHTALVPTGKIPDISKMTEMEVNILTMIYKRFLAAFLPNMVVENTNVLLTNKEHLFHTSGRRVLDKGFSLLYGGKTEDKELLDLKEGQTVHVESSATVKISNKPEERFTDGTLLATMADISKRIKDKEYAKLMKDKGIGTQATRSEIIKSIINDGYVEKKKDKKKMALYITDKGRAYVENLEGLQIMNPELSAEWEQKLRMVEHGELSKDNFESEMHEFVCQMICDIESKKVTRAPSKSKKVSLGTCPLCGGEVYAGEKKYFCSNWKEKNCQFGIFKEFMGAKITEKNAATLMSGKSIKKSLTKKDGTEWEQAIYYDTEQKKICFVPRKN